MYSQFSFFENEKSCFPGNWLWDGVPPSAKSGAKVTAAFSKTKSQEKKVKKPQP
jgi:hypothetical protein